MAKKPKQNPIEALAGEIYSENIDHLVRVFGSEDDLGDFVSELGVEMVKEAVQELGVDTIGELIVKLGSIEDKTPESLAPSERTCGIALTQELLEAIPAGIVKQELGFVEEEWKAGKPMSEIVKSICRKHKLELKE